jgi:hypothetical protein
MRIHPRLPGLLLGGAAGLAGLSMLAAAGDPSRAQSPGPPPAAPAVAPARLAAPQRVVKVRKVVVRRREPLPVRIQVPAIGIDAPLVRLGLDRGGALQVPGRSELAGWYVGSARPGERGPAIIAGHVDSVSGPAVFYRLGALRPGNAIRVRRGNGSWIGFRVRRVERWPKAHFPTAEVYGATRRPTLRLITCGGAFDAASGHYLDNTLVFATRA